ncbi:nitrogen fixation protein [Methanobrevibacter sp. TMH8]|uniref:NifB/NifX family molybdenum-iron cluster-binding protein n=1 Tax=Methanobrevibacter sp. TMH8 TaxID=2848611 RepID=UPI001CCF6961|nr:NifB/NifX family molybdenum-iron cluster-binding protein [Methanobrevibacter sp. TMH8]MBZ9570711.1 nitrogen fixation protein [Methanobrevibacter sp. TMH8]
MKVAVASTDGKNIDLHFGDANQFFIFNIIGKEFLELRKKVELPLEDHSERWRASIDLLYDCKALLCKKIGKEPHIELRKKGIKVIVIDSKIDNALDECYNHLNLNIE